MVSIGGLSCTVINIRFS